MSGLEGEGNESRVLYRILAGELLVVRLRGGHRGPLLPAAEAAHDPGPGRGVRVWAAPDRRGGRRTPGVGGEGGEGGAGGEEEAARPPEARPTPTIETLAGEIDGVTA